MKVREEGVFSISGAVEFLRRIDHLSVAVEGTGPKIPAQDKRVFHDL